MYLFLCFYNNNISSDKNEDIETQAWSIYTRE